MDIYTLFKQIADANIDYIMENGHAPSGCNGPYKNDATPIRNSGHWLISFSYLWNQTKDTRYYEVARILAEYLLLPDNYGPSGSIIHRKDVRFDKVNGLIGQAWTIEALVEAAWTLKEEKYYQKAKELFLIQKFNKSKHIWRVVDADGEISLGLVFNQQLWFAAVGSLILDYEEQHALPVSKSIEDCIVDFLHASDKELFQVQDDGQIVHLLNYKLSDAEKKYRNKLNTKRKIKSLLNNPPAVITKKIHDKMQKYPFTEGLENAYHLFNLYGFAILKKRYEDMEIYSSAKMRMALEYIEKSNLLENLHLPCGGNAFNKFGYGYNSPAFEYPFVSLCFGKENMEKNIAMMEKQVELLFDAKGNSFSKNCADSQTADARIYELVRYFRSKNM